jgi:DNA-binding LacI/PurR family transcriptional regulator
MEELVDRTPDVDGLQVASDVMASAAISVLCRSGRRVPVDVRVTGWDDSLIPEEHRPGITTLHIPYAEIGGRLARMLLEQVGGRPGGRIEHATTTIIRRASA